MSYTLEQIASFIGARVYGVEHNEISWLLTDSRSLCFPESTLFFAIESARNDGHRYINELYRRGVRAFVVNKEPQDILLYPEAGFLLVQDTLKALQRLAERHRESFDIPVVGITGSNGKTIVKEWLYQLLSSQQVVTRSPRSYNSQIGVPLSVWAINEHTDIGIFEAGISQKDEMDALQTIIQPTIGVFTCLGEAHQENFKTREEKCAEKWKLFKDADIVVYCAEEKCVVQHLQKNAFQGEHLIWSRIRHDVPLYISSVVKHDDNTTITYIYKEKEGTYDLPFIDEAAITNSITCLAVCLYLGMDDKEIFLGMKKMEPVAMRLEVKEGRSGCTLINDSYNSDLNSLDIALDFMSRRIDKSCRKRTLILSDVEQSGEMPETLYAKVAQLVESRGVDTFIGIGPDLYETQRLFNVNSYFFKTIEDFLESRIMEKMHDELILIKGARSYRFDKLTDLLSLKVHQTTLEVNLNAVVANLNYYRSFMKPGTKVTCMVKASAYGCGAVEVAKTLQEHQVDYLAVAVADEGAELRKAGVSTNIMVMNPEMGCFNTLFEYELEPEVYSFRMLDALITAAEKEGVTNFPIHIKLDTGMHRLGFHPEKDMPYLIDRLKKQSAVVPRSVFSHFVGSDNDAFDDFSAQQYRLFIKGCNELQSAYQHTILRHICNSAAIEHFPERHMEMVRLGLGLYGVNARNNEMLNNVSTLRTTILQMHELSPSETVGYSRRGVLERNTKVATLPIGYADGLDRKLGCGKGYCIVNGQKAPYIGNICMDVCMIDVTGIDCHEGDSVVIFGEDLPVTVLSDIVETIPYEILTGISTRVRRVYYQD
ncbi:MAG: bifunctional UDP-N-acetylmuramoyl-tripeptide:D-alanyl-D-alanine ligase/alanine racemase [Paraprevotella sp.]|nr:bifunctional UDP-N-acetylmuramoyl-tripeptide:D-alanyl-D-alanine ligase/alanine racemase [Paraprevotella sp.]